MCVVISSRYDNVSVVPTIDGAFAYLLCQICVFLSFYIVKIHIEEKSILWSDISAKIEINEIWLLCVCKKLRVSTSGELPSVVLLLELYTD